MQSPLPALEDRHIFCSRGESLSEGFLRQEHFVGAVQPLQLVPGPPEPWWRSETWRRRRRSLAVTRLSLVLSLEMFKIPAYQFLVRRRMPLLNTTSRRAAVWPPSCQTGWQSAAWQSRWRKRHHPPWEGETASLSAQLRHNSLRWECIRETHTAVMHWP